MNEEELNPNFDINAKYESMLEVSERIVKDYISKNNDLEPSSEICLAYDVKNYLPILQQENQQLKEQFDNALKIHIADHKYASECEDKVITYKSVLDEIREYINNYDVFKEFSFPLMKRDEENQVKSSIDYEFQTSIKKSLLQILDKVNSEHNSENV